MSSSRRLHLGCLNGRMESQLQLLWFITTPFEGTWEEKTNESLFRSIIKSLGLLNIVQFKNMKGRGDCSEEEVQFTSYIS